jgi:hypothetical protein
LEQAAAFLFECGPVCVARPAGAVALGMDAKIYFPVCHVGFLLFDEMKKPLSAYRIISDR